MKGNDLFRAMDVAGSGLAAERRRMEVIAQNLANATVTRMADGSGPYRRKQLVFESELQRAGFGSDRGPEVAGVRVTRVMKDPSPLRRVHNPGHPDADAEGYVLMPNVSVPVEMVDLMTASRAYEANLSTIRAFQEMLRQTLALGR